MKPTKKQGRKTWWWNGEIHIELTDKGLAVFKKIDLSFCEMDKNENNCLKETL